MLKILSWNIQQGGGSRIHQIISKLVNSGVQIIILSEYRNNDKGNYLRSQLMHHGYRYQVVTHAKKDSNSVIILSKLPGNGVLYPNADSEYGANIACLEFEAFRVCGVYLPHKKKHKLLPFMTILGQGEQYIFCGDFNTGKNGIDQKGNSFWYTDELEQLEISGYVDAFRAIKGDVREYSWYSHQGNGYRYDHKYVSKQLLPIIKDCYYIHEWREEKISDHAPMILELA